MIDNLEKRKKELIEQSKQGIDAKVAEYKALLSKAAEGQNQAAARDYEKMPQDNLTRSAYLNRLQKPDYDAISAAGSYYDKLTDTSDYAALRQKDLINKEKMAYEDARNAEAQRRYEAEFNAYQKALAASRSSGGYGGSSNPYSNFYLDLTDSDATAKTSGPLNALPDIVKHAFNSTVQKEGNRTTNLTNLSGLANAVINETQNGKIAIDPAKAAEYMRQARESGDASVIYHIYLLLEPSFQ